MKKFLKNFFLLGFSTAIINIISTYTNAFISRKLGNTFIGSFTLVNTLFRFLMTISLFGVPLAITKLVSEELAKSNNTAIKKITNIGCTICAITSLLTCIFTIFFYKQISDFFIPNITDKNVLIVLAFSLPFIAISSVVCGYFQALRKVEITVVDEFITQFSQSAIIVLLISLKYNSYIIFSIAILISQILSFFYTFIMYKKDIRKIGKSTSSTINYTNEIFRIALPISFTSFVRSGLSTLKHALIPSRLEKYGFSRDYALSRYGLVHGIALQFVLIPWIIIECFASLILPEYSRYFATNDVERINLVTNRIFKIVLMLSIYIAFIIYIISDKVCMAIYENSEVSYYVKILTPLIPIMYIDTIVDNMLRGLDLQLNVMKVNIIDVIVSILLIYYAVPYLGTAGYILVIYTGEYLNGILSIETLLNKINIKFNFVNWIFLPLIIGFIALFLCIKLEYILIIKVLLFSSIYFIFVYIIDLILKKNKA